MLANDLEGVNYSSIRAGLMDEREFYKSIQRWFIDTITTPIFEAWLETNILNGTLNLPVAKLDKFNSPDWKPRRWAWVDPEKDINAQIKAVDNHFKSRRQVISEGGGDIEDVLRDIKRDEDLAEEVGLDKPEEGTN
jgi:lambda family phage portal protein